MWEEILIGRVVEVDIAWNDEPWGVAQKWDVAGKILNIQYSGICTDSVCRTCPRLDRFLWRWGPPGLFPSGHTAAAPSRRRHSLGRAPRTRAAPMSACGSCSWERSSEGKQVWKKWWRIRRERCENVLQIGKNDAWNRVRGLCSIPSHPHTTSTGIQRGEQWGRYSFVSLPLLLPSDPASISFLLPDNPVLRRCWRGFSSTVSGRQGQNPNYTPGQETEPPRILHCRSAGETNIHTAGYKGMIDPASSDTQKK